MISFFLNLFKKNVKDYSNSTVFRGMNLDFWDYLGYSEVTYTDNNGKTEARAFVYFFEHKEKDERHYEIVSQNSLYSFLKHSYILTVVELWKIYEKKSYEAIMFPSSSLKSKMVEIGYEWNAAEATWKKIKKYEVSENSNVVTLMK